MNLLLNVEAYRCYFPPITFNHKPEEGQEEPYKNSEPCAYSGFSLNHPVLSPVIPQFI